MKMFPANLSYKELGLEARTIALSADEIVEKLRLFRDGFWSSNNFLAFSGSTASRLLGADASELIGKEPTQGTIDSVAERLAEASETVKEWAKTNQKDSYYYGLIEAYGKAIEINDGVVTAGRILRSESVLFVLDDSRLGTVPLSKLEAKLSKRESRELTLGIPIEMQIAHNCEVSRKLIDEHEAYRSGMNSRVHELHLELLSYAQQNFGKDEIGVYLDITSHERFGGVNLKHVNGALWLTLGVTEIPSCFGDGVEFNLRLGEGWKEHQPYVRDAYLRLATAREGRKHGGAFKYESHTFGNDYEKDRQIALQLRQQFPQYVSKNAPWLFKIYHGSMMFENVVVIDFPRIMTDHSKSYEPIVEGITDAVRSLLPKPMWLRIQEQLEK